jgi:hypothetical protein
MNKAKILIVEDELLVGRNIALKLNQIGHNVAAIPVLGLFTSLLFST